MFDWLRQSLASGPKVPPGEVLLRLAIAFALGLVVAAVYRQSRPKETIAPTFPTTLVLLAILIAMVTQVIGDNVARAFSLVGALSIVRFRTVVRDTQDTAYVIFAVVIGMAVGANDLLVAVAGIGVVGVASFFLRLGKESDEWHDVDSRLSLRVGVGHDPQTLFQTVFGKYLQRHEILSVATARQGIAIELNYKVRLRDPAAPTELVKELNQIEGVQSVELRRQEEESL